MPSEDRKAELVHLFLEVTQSSDEAQATQMLEWYGWQVDRAVSAFMLGDVTPPRSYVEDSGGVASGPGLGDDVGLDGASMAGADIRRNDPRAPPGMYSIVMGLPLRLLGKLLSYALTPINYALGVEEQPKDGGAAARRFVSQFQVEYGHERRPQFVEESYREAVREAARQHKFMMVYLHSPLHQDTPHFCRTTLCAAPMVDFMEHNVVVWGGSMVHGEAFAVSRALDACAFPYVALLLCKRNQVQVVERVEGTENAERLLDRLTGAMAAFQEQLEHVYRQQREVDEARRLREEQDNEYRRGVEADRRRQEVQEEERRAREQEAEDARAKAEAAAAEVARQEQDHAERLDAIRRQVRDEPPPGTNMARIRLQLPNGSKVDRRFAADATVGEVRGFLTLHLADNNIPIRNFSLSTNFPRKTYGEEDDAQSVVEAGLHPQVALFVHDLDA